MLGDLKKKKEVSEGIRILKTATGHKEQQQQQQQKNNSFHSISSKVTLHDRKSTGQLKATQCQKLIGKAVLTQQLLTLYTTL